MKKQQRTIIFVLLNILFCACLLWYFSRNAIIRTYAGSPIREVLTGVVLLATMYANYFLIYPKLHQKHPVVYWVVMVLVVIASGVIELAIAYPGIMRCNGMLVEQMVFFAIFSSFLKMVAARNLAFNFIPTMLRMRQDLQKALEKDAGVD